MFKKTKDYLFCTLIGLCALACNESKTPISNLEMGDLLDIKGKMAMESGQVPYYTDLMLKRFEREYNSKPVQMRYNSALDYGLMLLLNGQNQKAINVLIEFLDLDESEKKVSAQTLQHYKVLALAYLREAEYQNCIYNHNGESCIIPLEGNGIHALADPARLAKDAYLALLEYDAKDYQSIWFYNIASMAAGDYPANMVEGFVIAPEKFYGEDAFPRFENVAMEAGVSTMDHAGGSIVDDFDNDGLLDIFTSSYGLSDQSRFYRNKGDGTFEDKSKAMGVDVLKAGLNCIQGDFNNDGWKDIFIMRGAWLGENGQMPNSLLLNRAGQYFEDVTKSANLFNEKPSGAVATADVDLDGDLDIFVGNESGVVKLSSDLFMNKGDGSFENIAEEAGVEAFAYVKSANFGDVNNDGWPDLFLSVYQGKNKLFINKGLVDGKVQFEEDAQAYGVDQPIYSFSSWFWDYDQDGWEDLLVFAYDNTNPFLISAQVCKEYLGLGDGSNKPMVYRNTGSGSFELVLESGLEQSLYTMGGNFGDLNNDGYPDFYAGTGEFNLWATIPNKMYLNKGAEGFSDVTHNGGFGMIQKGHGISFGDLDNDGDQDVYHQVGGAVESDVYHNVLFKNPGFEKNNWISLELKGTQANRSAIGARVIVSLEMQDGTGRKIYTSVSSGGSFGANTLRSEIGLGEAKRIKQIEIKWPGQNQSSQIIEKVEMNRFYVLEENTALAEVNHRRVALGSQAIVECINY